MPTRRFQCAIGVDLYDGHMASRCACIEELQAQFPNADRETLENIFQAQCGNMMNTVEVLKQFALEVVNEESTASSHATGLVQTPCWAWNDSLRVNRIGAERNTRLLLSSSEMSTIPQTQSNAFSQLSLQPANTLPATVTLTALGSSTARSVDTVNKTFPSPDDEMLEKELEAQRRSTSNAVESFLVSNSLTAAESTAASSWSATAAAARGPPPSSHTLHRLYRPFERHIRSHLRRLVNWSRRGNGLIVSVQESEGNILRMQYITVSARALKNMWPMLQAALNEQQLPCRLKVLIGGIGPSWQTTCTLSWSVVTAIVTKLTMTRNFYQYARDNGRRSAELIVERIYNRGYCQVVEASSLLKSLVEKNENSGSYFRGKNNLIHAAMKRGQRNILEAAQVADVVLVQDFLLDDPACVKAIDHNSCTALHFAASAANTEITRLLLHFKANVNAVSTLKSKDEPLLRMTPIKMVLQGEESESDNPRRDAPFSRSRFEVLKQLLSANADVSKIGVSWISSFQNSLRNGCHMGHLEVEAVSLLCDAKANFLLRRKDGNGMTFLHHAAAIGNLNAARKILNANADVNAKDSFGRSPLQFSSSNLEVVQLFISAGADVNARDKCGASPFHEASMYGHLAAVQLLLKHGADVNSLDRMGRSPLFFAIGHLKVAQMLMDAKADVNAQDCNGRYLLLDAAMRGDADVVRMLIAGRANVNICNKQGSSPLQQAAANGYLEIVRLLVDAGAGVSTHCGI
jgi:ankyrin repeat protein